MRERLRATELMDDLGRPDAEFADAYRELASVNRKLGGIRAIRRFLPSGDDLSILDVAAGGCDVGEALTEHRVVSLDINSRGLRYARLTKPLVGDALKLPFRDSTFDVVMSSAFFHHLDWSECVSVLREMWRTTRGRVIVNDLHRHPLAYASIRLLVAAFSKSVMVKHDGPVSVLRAFKPEELARISREAGVRGGVYRSFPYRIVLVADKK